LPVLHVYYSFCHKCSKFDTVTNQGQKNSETGIKTLILVLAVILKGQSHENVGELGVWGVSLGSN
jgi:hypothetical protein